ncbi:MAG: (5-formylfuran-3-yl)methyl phosphate synthase [Methanomicrobiales archaeon]|nr:(5-formylfuran-3-yl)methyl phosphate synthase [Methanomicrobiales archaeon]
MQLLVSPRDLAEVTSALSADIVDIKNPLEGSLGANFPWVIRAARGMTQKPLSAAIGDYDFKPGGASLAAYGAATAGADYIKAGLKFEGREKAREFIRAVVRGVREEYDDRKVVIAAYSDFGRLGSISPMEIPAIAHEEGADVVMIDTGMKDGRSTFDFMDEATLRSFVDESRELGLQTAIAGSLAFRHLDTLRRIGPDIVGVRGMVCEGGREGSIRPELVEKALRLVR